jgi:hypothetical protein
MFSFAPFIAKRRGMRESRVLVVCRGGEGGIVRWLQDTSKPRCV